MKKWKTFPAILQFFKKICRFFTGKFNDFSVKTIKFSCKSSLIFFKIFPQKLSSFPAIFQEKLTTFSGKFYRDNGNIS